MKKTPKKSKKDDAAVTLGDMIGKELANQLKDKQQELKKEEEKRKEEETLRKREERRLKEKNKTFEELLADSSLDWKEYK